MLFLLNTVVVKTQLTLELPPGLEALAQMAPAARRNAGGGLYGKHPTRAYGQPGRAPGDCTRQQHKFPTAGAAHFALSGGRYVGRLAEVPLAHLVRVLSLQEHGTDIGHEVWQVIWSSGKAA